MKKLFNCKEFARLAGVNRRIPAHRADRKKIQGRKVGREWFFTWQTTKNYVESRGFNWEDRLNLLEKEEVDSKIKNSQIFIPRKKKDKKS
ncbi:MAG TPA: hypothetical protein VGC58_02350 [Candidatus Paceibacterota bacterium]